MRATALTIGLSLAAALAAAGSARALPRDIAYASDNGGGPTNPNFVPVSLQVTAKIGTTCGTTTLPDATVNLGELNGAISDHQVAISVKCTGAFRMGVVSANGGLKAGVAVPSGYANLRDYNVALHIVDDTLAANDSSTCLASQLTTGSSACPNLIGPATASAPGFRVPNPSSDEPGSYLLISNASLPGSSTLVASTGYTDTLTITLTASP